MLQTICAGFLGLVWTVGAKQPAYLDTSLPAERQAVSCISSPRRS